MSHLRGRALDTNTAFTQNMAILFDSVLPASTLARLSRRVACVAHQLGMIVSCPTRQPRLSWQEPRRTFEKPGITVMAPV